MEDFRTPHFNFRQTLDLSSRPDSSHRFLGSLITIDKSVGKFHSSVSFLREFTRKRPRLCDLSPLFTREVLVLHRLISRDFLFFVFVLLLHYLFLSRVILMISYCALNKRLLRLALESPDLSRHGQSKIMLSFLLLLCESLGHPRVRIHHIRQHLH